MTNLDRILLCVEKQKPHYQSRTGWWHVWLPGQAIALPTNDLQNPNHLRGRFSGRSSGVNDVADLMD